MHTNSSDFDSPLSRFLSDDNLSILENMIPYCPPSLGKTLALQLKIMEIQKILTGFDDISHLRACGFEENSQDIESILRNLKNSVSEEKARQIDSLLGALQFARLYQKYNEITKEHPEFFQGSSKKLSADSFPSSSGDLGPFSDPNIFLMLNSLINGENSGTGGNEKMKKLLDMMMAGNGENTDFSELLSTLLKNK